MEVSKRKETAMQRLVTDTFLWQTSRNDDLREHISHT